VVVEEIKKLKNIYFSDIFAIRQLEDRSFRVVLNEGRERRLMLDF